MNRGPSRLGIELVETLRNANQNLIDNHTDRTQRMVYRHPLFQRHVTEHRLLFALVSTHTTKTFQNDSKSLPRIFFQQAPRPLRHTCREE